MDINNNRPDLPEQDPNRKKRNRINLLIAAFAALFSLGLIFFATSAIQSSTNREISYTKFINMLKKGEVQKVTFESDRISIEPKQGQQMPLVKVTYYTGYVNDTTLVQDMLNKYGVEFTAQVDSGGSGILQFLATYILPFAALWVLFYGCLLYCENSSQKAQFHTY